MNQRTDLQKPGRAVVTVFASFIIMLSLGGIYAWSIIVPELQRVYLWSGVQTQLIFGIVIAVFPATMILAGRLQQHISPRIQALLATLFFGSGYLLAGYSQGNFYLVLSGIGVLAGIGTGFGYLTALTIPVQWFPSKKGLITGIASAGFGLAAVVLTYLIEHALDEGLDVMAIFRRIGWGYGALILIAAFFIKSPEKAASVKRSPVGSMLKTSDFLKLFAGIFFGTFAGLMVLGNLRPIGAEHGIDNHILMMGVSVFAVANFAGRLSWGWFSDYISARICIITALLLQAVSVFLTGFLQLTAGWYLALALLIGFSFGANFVLFAKKSAQHFGIANLGAIYPFVFMGYAIAGIFGPLTGGYLYDTTGSFHYASYVAAAMSLTGALIFILFRKKSA